MNVSNSPRLEAGDGILNINIIIEGLLACENMTSGVTSKHTRYVLSFLQLLENVVLCEHIFPNYLWGKGVVQNPISKGILDDTLRREGVLIRYEGLSTLTNVEALNSRISVYKQALSSESVFLEDIAFSETAHVKILPYWDDINSFAKILQARQENFYRPILGKVYSTLSQSLQTQVDEIRSFSHSDEIRIPPISSIIINKASNLKDIPEILLETRKKMAKVRHAFREYEAILQDTQRPLKTRLRVLRDIQLISTELSKPYDHIDSLHITEWADVWSLFEDLVGSDFSPSKLAGKLLDKPLNYLVKRLRMRSAYYLFTLKHKALSSSSQLNRINKLFGQPVDKDLLMQYTRASNEFSLSLLKNETDNQEG